MRGDFMALSYKKQTRLWMHRLYHNIGGVVTDNSAERKQKALVHNVSYIKEFESDATPPFSLQKEENCSVLSTRSSTSSVSLPEATIGSLNDDIQSVSPLSSRKRSISCQQQLHNTSLTSIDTITIQGNETNNNIAAPRDSLLPEAKKLKYSYDDSAYSSLTGIVTDLDGTLLNESTPTCSQKCGEKENIYGTPVREYLSKSNIVNNLTADHISSKYSVSDISNICSGRCLDLSKPNVSDNERLHTSMDIPSTQPSCQYHDLSASLPLPEIHSVLSPYGEASTDVCVNFLVLNSPNDDDIFNDFDDRCLPEDDCGVLAVENAPIIAVTNIPEIGHDNNEYGSIVSVDLPLGWRRQVSKNGQEYFVNSDAFETSMLDPRIHLGALGHSLLAEQESITVALREEEQRAINGLVSWEKCDTLQVKLGLLMEKMLLQQDLVKLQFQSNNNL